MNVKLRDFLITNIFSSQYEATVKKYNHIFDEQRKLLGTNTEYIIVHNNKRYKPINIKSSSEAELIALDNSLVEEFERIINKLDYIDNNKKAISEYLIKVSHTIIVNKCSGHVLQYYLPTSVHKYISFSPTKKVNLPLDQEYVDTHMTLINKELMKNLVE